MNLTYERKHDKLLKKETRGEDNMNAMKFGCLVMAAGNARRFGANKLGATVEGKMLIRRTLEAIPAQAFVNVCVVTQYDFVAELANEFDFAALRNGRPEDGVSRTIRLGLAQLQEECDAVLFLVADQPFLRRETLLRLLAQGDETHIIVPVCGAQRGNPCLFPRRYYPELLALSGDRGGRSVIRAHGDAVLCVEVDGRELLDVDTPEILAVLS